MARKLIGTGVTDANGEATITYTGTGAGKLNIVAESGTFVSETSTIMDYINYDNGIDGDSSDIWTGATSSLTRTATGSVFSSTSAQKLITTALISGDFEATFQAYGTDSPLWGVEDANSNRTRFYMRNDESFTYYKITRSNGVITAKYSFDGNIWTNLTAQSSDVTSADCYFLFHNNNGTKTTTFKNLKIYPI